MTNTVTIKLPWPSSLLNPNQRLHWHEKARAVKSARSNAYYEAKAQAGNFTLSAKRIKASYTLHPPDKRRRDKQNIIASLKAAQDGVADAIGVDDHFFDDSYRLGEVVPGGQVLLIITQEARP